MSHPKPQKVLLAGSRGCIGRAFRAFLKREHPDVEVVPLAPFPFSLQAVGENLRSGSYTHFVNCAALGNDRESVEEPYPYFDTNAAGVVKHLELIRQHSPSTRYLNLGTVYEADPERKSPYVVSKRMARQAVQSYRENHGLYAVTATLGFTEYYGRPENCLARRIVKGVAAIAQAIREGRSFEPLVLRDLDQSFTWTWAEDVTDGMWRMLNQAYHEHDGIPAIDASHEWWDRYYAEQRTARETWRPSDYSLITPESHTVRKFVEKAFAAAGICGQWAGKGAAEVFYATETHESNGQGWTDTHWLVRLSAAPSPEVQWNPLQGSPAVARAKADLNWEPRTSFRQLVERMVQADLAEVAGTEREAA